MKQKILSNNLRQKYCRLAILGGLLLLYLAIGACGRDESVDSEPVQREAASVSASEDRAVDVILQSAPAPPYEGVSEPESIPEPGWRDDGPLAPRDDSLAHDRVEASAEPPEQPFTLVRTYFATDRNLTGSSIPSEFFGDDRGEEITYGEAFVSIPRKHEFGKLESPFWLRFEFTEDPEKHVVLMHVTARESQPFFDLLTRKVNASARNSAFVFVHGYNVSFEDAARRTAQISFDMRFDGAPVFYSWPSQANTVSYTVDEQEIEWAQANIKTFLMEFFAQSGAENIYLVAHSMGNRGLTRALADVIREQPEIHTRLTEVILAAPDIDAGVFRRDIAPALAAAGKPITLYASSEDKALKASKRVHGNPRAGEAGQSIVIVNGVETIDATGVDTSFLRHSYIAESHSAVSDMIALIREGKRPDQRELLVSVQADAGKYWKFRQ